MALATSEMLISELEKNAAEKKTGLLFTVVTFPVLVNVPGYGPRYSGDKEVYIYRPFLFQSLLKNTTEGLDCQGKCLSAALGETRGVDAWLVASAVSPFGAPPFCPLAPSKLKPFSSAPIFHQCHAYYRRILPSTHTNNDGK